MIMINECNDFSNLADLFFIKVKEFISIKQITLIKFLGV